MSWRATAWAKETRGHPNPGQKLVLMILADYANPTTNLAWPDEGRLADDAEVSLRSVERHIVALTRAGFITLVQRGNQHGPSMYHLEIGAPAILAGAESGAPATQGIEHPPPRVSNKGKEPPGEPPSLPSVESEHEEIIHRPKPVPITKAYVERMVKQYAPLLGGEAKVREQIEEAMNHVAFTRRANKQLYLTGWLRRNAEGGHTNGRSQGRTGPDRRAPVGRPDGTEREGSDW